MAAASVSSGASETPTAGSRKGSIGTSTPLKGFAFSWTSVCIAETATLPIDTIKVRMQLQGEAGAVKVYKNAMDGAQVLHSIASTSSNSLKDESREIYRYMKTMRGSHHMYFNSILLMNKSPVRRPPISQSD